MCSSDLFPSHDMAGGTWKTQYPQYQLAVKTYDSDIYQNWVNTDWIDGSNGINEITAVNVADGKLTMDALNLAQKVYNMLNRIAISGGTYRDWLETVYTTGQYIERPETPIFEGGMTQYIEFDEVVSQSATEEEPLGTLAGRGKNTIHPRKRHYHRLDKILGKLYHNTIKVKSRRMKIILFQFINYTLGFFS